MQPCPCGNPYTPGITCCYRTRKPKGQPTTQHLKCNVSYGNIKPSWRMQQNGGYVQPKQAMRGPNVPQYLEKSIHNVAHVSATPTRSTASALHTW